MHKETGIIMSGDHPRLVLAGLKTMTRRTAGLNKINENPGRWNVTKTLDPAVWAFYRGIMETPLEVIRIKCPYGQVGDRLWVRETTWYFAGSGRPHYVATEEPNRLSRHFGKVKPSIHLFKKDARIWLEITGLRAERLRNASLADAIAEGFKTVEELIRAVICLNHLPEDADPWLWVISFKLLTER